MKKGFSLIELLGVVVVLGTLILMATLTLKDTVKQSTEDLYQKQLEGIEQSARVWGAKHIGSLPDEGESIEVTLGELKKDGSADYDLKDPRTGDLFDDDTTKVIIKNNNGNYAYEVVVE